MTKPWIETCSGRRPVAAPSESRWRRSSRSGTVDFFWDQARVHLKTLKSEERWDKGTRTATGPAKFEMASRPGSRWRVGLLSGPVDPTLLEAPVHSQRRRIADSWALCLHLVIYYAGGLVASRRWACIYAGGPACEPEGLAWVPLGDGLWRVVVLGLPASRRSFPRIFVGSGLLMVWRTVFWNS